MNPEDAKTTEKLFDAMRPNQRTSYERVLQNLEILHTKAHLLRASFDPETIMPLAINLTLAETLMDIADSVTYDADSAAVDHIMDMVESGAGLGGDWRKLTAEELGVDVPSIFDEGDDDE